MKLKELLLKAQEEIIEAIQNNECSITKFETENCFYGHQLSQIWLDVDFISQENKFDEEDVFETPLAVIYLLYCCPIQLMAVIKDKRMIHEYWDFFLDEYPEIKFDGNIDEFYNAVERYKM